MTPPSSQDKKFERKKPENGKSTCYYCNKTGHYSKECRARLWDEARDKKRTSKGKNMKEELEHGTGSNQGEELGEKMDSLRESLDFLRQAKSLIAEG